MRRKKQVFHNKVLGFTLIELLVSAGVLSLVSIIIAQVLFTTVRLNTRTELLKEIKQTGSATMETMKRMIQNAKSITSTCTETEPLSELTLVNIDGGETILGCTIDDTGTYRIASSSSYLSSANVTVVNDATSDVAGCGSLQFICSTVGRKGSSVAIEFRIRQKNETSGLLESAAETFVSTATTRNN